VGGGWESCAESDALPAHATLPARHATLTTHTTHLTAAIPTNQQQVLSWTTDAMLDHAKRLLEIPGARVAWGAEPLAGHSIPDVYGAIKPTAIFVPLERMLEKQAWFELATTEVFGPFQVLTEYGSSSLPSVLEMTERMDAHLTAAVVSNDVRFVNEVLANTVNGTTYVGMRGRTTGAPQNHWFGPAGDPRGAGIGTPEAIRLVWSCHREVIGDFGRGVGGSVS